MEIKEYSARQLSNRFSKIKFYFNPKSKVMLMIKNSMTKIKEKFWTITTRYLVSGKNQFTKKSNFLNPN